MFKLFDKDKTKENTKDDLIIKVTSLLIHVAKIDENYTNKEKEIIKRTLIELGVDDKSLENILKKATEIEKNSNQILEFTREVKNKDELFKAKLIEALWKLIYADGFAAMN